MKLRNKKTGEITSDYSYILLESTHYKTYHSLAELNEEWEDAPDEEWRDVLGFEELYQVSNLGNVRTVKRGEATVMSQKEHWNGYLSVHLRNKGVERRASVHRLVAEAFIPNPDGLRDVNHKNGIKTDNRVENLEWLSHSDNMKHQYQVLKTGRYGHLYKPTEPLIKDEKIRKAVRAWAEANEVVKAFIVMNERMNWTVHGDDADRNRFRIEFFDRVVPENDETKNYTIAELCGEEEE